jgi:hypothetical protein
MEEEKKQISITGTNNKYMMNKLTNGYKKENKKRIVSDKWTFPNEFYEHENQYKMIIDIINNNYTYKDDITKTLMNEVNRKIYGYKQQDTLKKHLEEDKFLTLVSVLNKMRECELKCRYCLCKMSVLYDVSREMTQWSVDRIDNDKGHNIDNFHLACLECNLKRRRRTDEKFLFTKQLNIIKKEN